MLFFVHKHIIITNMKKNYLIIARKSESPFAIETKLTFNDGSDNDTDVVIVNVEHGRQIAAGVQYIKHKINTKELTVDEETERFIKKLINLTCNKERRKTIENAVLKALTPYLGFEVKQEQCIFAC